MEKDTNSEDSDEWPFPHLYFSLGVAGAAVLVTWASLSPGEG